MDLANPNTSMYSKYKKPLLILIAILTLLAIGLLTVRLITNKATDTDELPYVLAEPILGVEPSREFTFKLNYKNKKVDELIGGLKESKFLDVYVDPEFTIPAPEATVIDGITLLVTPNKHISFSNDIANKVGAVPIKLYERDTWSFSKEYYIVQKRSFENGEMLVKPIVTRFTVKSSKPTPVADFSVNNMGVGTFKWAAVENAQSYYVVRYAKSEGIDVLGSTTKTEWNTIEQDEEYAEAMARGGSYLSGQNRQFRAFDRSQDDLRNPNFNIDASSMGAADYTYGVVAKLADGTYTPTGLLKGHKISEQLPLSQASFANKELIGSHTLPNYDAIPTHLVITMADGTSVRRSITIDLAKTRETAKISADLSEGGDPTKSSLVPTLTIPYSIDGTMIKSAFTIDNYDKATFAQEVRRVVERNKQAQTPTGAREVYAYQAPLKEIPSGVSKVAPKVPYKLHGSSEFVRYLAANIIVGSRAIDVNKYVNDDRGIDFVDDAIQEAVYQNVYAYNLKSYTFSPSDKVIIASYTKPDQKTVREEQAATAKKADEIVASIIKGGMSDEQKVRAINTYIVDTVDYDFEALKIGKELDGGTGFIKSIEEFRRSWTAGGALLDQKAVCTGYALAFQVLAEKAGLESVQVTGLANSEAHAWNKVKVDGKWRIVDSTWNDSRSSPNRYLLVTDSQAEKLRHQTQTNSFMNDLRIHTYDTK